MNKKLQAYATVANFELHGADFEKRWFESVIMVLTRIQNNYYNPVETHKKLIEVCDGLDWIQNNLNDKLSLEHMMLLRQIYSLNIRIIQGAIVDNNMEYLDIVIPTLKTLIEPYYKK